jgi:hypothetical protein
MIARRTHIGQHGSTKRRKTATDLLRMEDLLAVKKFVELVGSIDKAREVLNALARQESRRKALTLL